MTQPLTEGKQPHKQEGDANGDVHASLPSNKGKNVEETKDRDPESGSPLLVDGYSNCSSMECSSMEIEEAAGESGIGERESWPNKREYLLSMIGFCVGIGNLWRFPYVCIRNGGGVFLIPFFFCLTLCALPLFFLESALGQFLQQGPIHVWKALCPISKGIGISMNIICLLTGWYYTVLLAWSLIYTFHSFRSPLPWTLCDQPWNTPNCVTRSSMLVENATVSSLNGTTADGYNSTLFQGGQMDNGTVLTAILNNNSSLLNASGAAAATAVVTRSASEEFWLHNVLEVSAGLEIMGGIPWHTLLALFLATLIIFCGIAKGIKTSGKVVYVTATLPYLLLTVLLIKGATLPGAYKGVIFYLKPDLSKLLKIQTWVEAAIQVFFSLGVAYGSLITMASYNKFKNNCLKDAVIVSLTSQLTSVYGGFAIFTIIGHMAHSFNLPVDTYARAGPGLAFVVYPEAIAQLPIPQFWGILFFVMLLTLGLDSQFNVMETLMTDIVDLYPRLLTKWRMAITAGVMTFVFLISIPFAARGGVYLFQLADWYISAYTVIIVGFLECIIVNWIYGADYFQRDLELMLGGKRKIFTYVWRYLTPALLTTVFISVVLTYKPPTYEGYTYNMWGSAVGWFMALISFIPIPIMAVHELWHTEGASLVQRIRKASRPTAAWRPADLESRSLYKRS